MTAGRPFLRFMGILLVACAFLSWRLYSQHQAAKRHAAQAALAAQIASEQAQQQRAQMFEDVKSELLNVGIPEAEAKEAAAYIAPIRLSGEPLSPEASAQAQALGITPIPFSTAVIDEYSNWVHQVKAPASNQ